MSQPYLGSYQSVTAEFTRPADTAIYASGDIICNSTSAPVLMTFSGAVRFAGGSGIILHAVHNKSNTDATNASFRLGLFRTAITPINDNAPATILFANRASRIGYIDFIHEASPSGSNATMIVTPYVNLDFVTDSAETAIYGRLIARGAYTPTSGEQHYIELGIARG